MGANKSLDRLPKLKTSDVKVLPCQCHVEIPTEIRRVQHLKTEQCLKSGKLGVPRDVVEAWIGEALEDATEKESTPSPKGAKSAKGTKST